jgi:hypothetical protein
MGLNSDHPSCCDKKNHNSRASIASSFIAPPGFPLYLFIFRARTQISRCLHVSTSASRMMRSATLEQDVARHAQYPVHGSGLRV